jgi:hypothetical protein
LSLNTRIDLSIRVKNTRYNLKGTQKIMKMAIRKTALLAFAALIMVSFAISYAHPAKAKPMDYRYKVHNLSSSRITQLMASDDGKKYLPFDIGAGIKPGETMELVWDKSTDNGACEWWVKAAFADGGVSPAAQFDFCEEDLVLEFK